MTVHEMECPNCGAPVDFGGSPQATCSFCRSVLSLSGGEITAASALNDLLAGAPVKRSELTPTPTIPQPTPIAGSHWTDFSDVADLARRGQKTEAIQLYRERTGVGVNEARYIVEAMALNETPASLSIATQVRTGKFALWGCLPVLFFVGMCAAFIILSSQVMFRVWGPLDETLQIINNDFHVKQVFGQPITPGLFVTGKISGNNNSSSARFSVPIYGPKHNGELNVNGSWRQGVWNLTIWIVYDENGVEQTITIARQVK